jgi:hypothetical protein
MPRSRRELLRLGAAAAVASLLPGRESAAATVSVSRARRAHAAVMADQPFVTRSVLAGQLNTYFRVVKRKAGSVDLELLAVNDLGSAVSAGTAGSELSFSAIFSGPGKNRLTQQTYPLRHRTLGDLSLFLVPVGPSGKTQRYEAIFFRPEA